MWLIRYWKPLAVLVLLVAVYAWGWSTGRNGALSDCRADKIKLAEQHLQAIEAERKRANAADEKLRAVLSRPKSGPKVREVVRAHPSNCRLPRAVSDSLREAVDRANAAAR